MAICRASSLILAIVSMAVLSISAFEKNFVPAKRFFCKFLAFVIISRISWLVFHFWDWEFFNSLTLILGTFTNISIRSIIGPESFARYRSIVCWLHIQVFSLSHKKPHGQGFRAPTSEKRAGYVALWWTRLIVIYPSSSGCRNVSIRFLGNSKNSSWPRFPSTTNNWCFTCCMVNTSKWTLMNNWFLFW